MHPHPASMIQFESHPSSKAVFPSSHPSTESLIPSPHIPVQMLVIKAEPPEQVHPEAAAVHKALHFVAPFRSPSSQNSVPTFLPSPHTGLQIESEVPEQANPSSIEQVLEHPSPPIEL